MHPAFESHAVRDVQPFGNPRDGLPVASVSVNSKYHVWCFEVLEDTDRKFASFPGKQPCSKDDVLSACAGSVGARDVYRRGVGQYADTIERAHRPRGSAVLYKDDYRSLLRQAGWPHAGQNTAAECSSCLFEETV